MGVSAFSAGVIDRGEVDRCMTNGDASCSKIGNLVGESGRSNKFPGGGDGENGLKTCIPFLTSYKKSHDVSSGEWRGYGIS